MSLSRLFGLALVLTALAFATAPAAEPAATVEMTDQLTYTPSTVTVKAGETVKWTNPSDLVHTVTADPSKANDPSHVHLPEGAETFDSGNIQPGGTYERTFTVPGRYQFFCIPHEAAGMIGEVTVEPKPTAEDGKAPAEKEEAAPKEAREEQPSPTAASAEKRGEYVFHAAGCKSCHTVPERPDGFLAGGRALESAFGTFYTPNITPHETGIGAWTEEDFVRAMTEGLSPDHAHYYPSFPYPWYARMRDGDLADLWAYLRTVPPVHNRVPEHELLFGLEFRPFIYGWKLLDFHADQAAIAIGPDEDPRLRGWYLVNALGHCGACHTPKNLLRDYDEERHLAGSEDIPGDFAAPNITPDPVTGIGAWSLDDIVKLLETGVRPDGTAVNGPMAEVVTDTTSRLTERDRRAIAVYLKSVPPVLHRVSERTAEPGGRHGGPAQDGAQPSSGDQP